MIICGIKITHDGGIALLENGRLVFSIEMEKINNNHRYSGINDLTEIKSLLEKQNYELEQIDRFVIDGWHGTDTFKRGASALSTTNEGKELHLPVAAYNEQGLKENVAQQQFFSNGLQIGNQDFAYSSYMHVTGHILGTYCTSPFAEKEEDSYVLVWDGGQYPRLYYVEAKTKKIFNLGHLFFLLGTIYSIIGLYFGPYKKTAEELERDKAEMQSQGFSSEFFGGLSIAGKIMSYIAQGEIRPDLLKALPLIYQSELEISNLFEHKFCKAIRRFVEKRNYSDADVLLTFHTYLQGQLIQTLREKVELFGRGPANFCFCGGSALNIKWNSAIRASEIFKAVYVPPFPNDSGSAIGAACAEMWSQSERHHIEWNPYAGPDLILNRAEEGWIRESCSLLELAQLLAKENEPVVFLSGRAEIGPRALGNRSIIAPAVDPAMQSKLNIAKKREAFRPVAPICLEADAPDIFDPGCPDPYMLFDHKVRAEWRNRVPAICHLDGTARLQTVSADSEAKEMRTLLEEYKKVSGIPLLCNTSANLNGSGFFPDVASATRWGRVKYVWSNGTLFTQTRSEVPGMKTASKSLTVE